jgi:hypothetical protein
MGLPSKVDLMGVSAELDDLLGPQTVDRLETELRSALRRRPANEARLGGALQLLAPYSERLREAMLAALDVLVHRGAYLRPLYLFILRGLVACREEGVAPLLRKALCLDDGAGLGTLAAAAMCTQSDIGAPLVKLAASRSPHLSFAGELARTARGESTGQGLTASALRIKESHRLQVVNCLVLPLVRERQTCPGAQAGIRVLQDAERHLGRWLLFGELAQLCGDTSPLVTARKRVAKGPSSARSAWSLVAWSLQGGSASLTLRPTLEIVSRLSDRPSAERDLSFLFRLAAAKIATARPMLEALCNVQHLSNESAVRAAGYLLREDGDRLDLQRRLLDVARSTKWEELRGLALAALQGSRPEVAQDAALDFVRSRQLQNAAFSALVRLAQKGRPVSDLISEPVYRRGQLGWLD